MKQNVMTLRGRALVALAIVMAFVLGILVGAFAHKSLPLLGQWFAPPETRFRWPQGFSVVEIQSSLDRSIQKAMFHSAPPGPKRPLLVSLHVWGGDFSSGDALARLAEHEGWNYLHPDFRGPSRGTKNCLSEEIVADIADAIDYGVRAGNVDPDRVFVVGFSGGGYTALGLYARLRHPVRAILSWAPIADLAAWHDESMMRGNAEVARQIRNCTGSAERLDINAARLRSPLFWTLPEAPPARIELFAGINDGYTGPVPISHSIRFFNRLADKYGARAVAVTSDEATALLARAVRPDSGIELDGRAVLFQRDGTFGSLTIFEGGHEMLPSACFARLLSLANAATAPAVAGSRQ